MSDDDLRARFARLRQIAEAKASMPDLFDVGRVPPPATAPWSGSTLDTAVTSRAAARSIQPDLSRLELVVFEQIQAKPSTCDDVEVATGLSHQTCSARVNALKAKGVIRESGTRQTRSGRRAVVWTT